MFTVHARARSGRARSTSVPTVFRQKNPQIPTQFLWAFRQYHATHFPDHDPDESITPKDLMDISADTSANPACKYYPYPNQSSFLLGEWYWNGSEKKSQSSFKNLIKIVGHPDFCPEDVAGQNWRLIGALLSGEPYAGLDEDGWEDEQQFIFLRNLSFLILLVFP